MNLTNPPTITTTTTATTTPETDTETPPPTKLSDHHHHHHPTKILSFTNGALKHHHHHSSAAQPTQSPAIYKECLKNHAASLGGHALDGCGEFMPSPTATASDPTSLKCAACGCHRNFHRREPEEGCAGGGVGTHIVEYIPHPHQILPPRGRSPNSASPPPISSSYYPSAPHMLLALRTGGNKHENSHGAGGGAVNNNNNSNVNGSGNAPATGSGGGRKRFRTKFSQEQKEKMLSFSERLGWKMQKRDEGLVEEFCNEVGVGKGVLKVWMHNNKHNFATKRSDVNSGSSSDDQPHHHPLLHSNNPNTINSNNNANTNTNSVTGHDHNHHNHGTSSGGGHVVNNNGSSSSS